MARPYFDAGAAPAFMGKTRGTHCARATAFTALALTIVQGSPKPHSLKGNK